MSKYVMMKHTSQKSKQKNLQILNAISPKMWKYDWCIVLISIGSWCILAQETKLKKCTRNK